MIRCIAFLASIIACTNVLGSAEVVTFRVNASGQIEVVVAGLTGCGQTRVWPADSVEIGTNTISINSVVGGSGGGCPAPPPPSTPYEVVTILGVLPPQTYTVNWSTSASPSGPRAIVLSATLTVPALVPSAIPTLSGYALLTLGLLLALSGACLTLRSSGCAGTPHLPLRASARRTAQLSR